MGRCTSAKTFLSQPGPDEKFLETPLTTREEFAYGLETIAASEAFRGSKPVDVLLVVCTRAGLAA